MKAKRKHHGWHVPRRIRLDPPCTQTLSRSPARLLHHRWGTTHRALIIAPPSSQRGRCPLACGHGIPPSATFPLLDRALHRQLHIWSIKRKCQIANPFTPRRELPRKAFVIYMMISSDHLILHRSTNNLMFT
jgi:hypothetical protein